MIFSFVVRRLRWLGRVPLLPQCFDAFLLVWTALTARARLRAIQRLEETACQDLGASTRVHRFGGVGFYVEDKELGHVHCNGLVDALVCRKERDVLVRAGKALTHHVFPASGWVSYWMEDESDSLRALELLRIARERSANECGTRDDVHASPAMTPFE